MNAWLNLKVWKLLVVLGLVKPAHLQPVAIRHEDRARLTGPGRRHH